MLEELASVARQTARLLSQPRYDEAALAELDVKAKELRERLREIDGRQRELRECMEGRSSRGIVSGG